MAASTTPRTKSIGNGFGSDHQEGARTGNPGRWVAQVINDLGGTRLRRLTPDTIETAFETPAAAGMSHSSFIKIRSVLGRALDYAQRRELVTTTIARIVEFPADAPAPKKNAR